jgi:Protein of unknown function (DUF2809)
MLIFNKKYAYFTVVLLLVEISIAIFFKDSFIRPFVGDVLVVILIYCLVRTFWKIDSTIAAILVLIFACTIEILQYFDFVRILGLQQNRILAIALGSTFDWKDILAYVIGTIAILWIEHRGIRN